MVSRLFFHYSTWLLLLEIALLTSFCDCIGIIRIANSDGLIAPRADSAASKDWTDDKAFENSILNSTNFYRREHNATALNWNDSLASYAQDWVDKCQFKHSVRPPN
jgi:hypothetical protein